MLPPAVANAESLGQSVRSLGRLHPSCLTSEVLSALVIINEFSLDPIKVKVCNLPRIQSATKKVLRSRIRDQKLEFSTLLFDPSLPQNSGCPS